MTPPNAHRVKLLVPLPVRVRLRLAVQRHVDMAGAWLCRTRRGSYVAEWLWRACRMW